MTVWNAAAQATFGWESNDVIGMKDPTVDTADAKDATFFYECLLGGATLTGTEITRKRKDGSTARITISGCPLRDESGRIRGAISFLTDITTHRELEETIQQMQKMEVIGHLAGGVAHDFNNILMAISSYGSLLSLQIPASDPNTRYVSEIQAATDRGAALTQGLLAFSRKQVLSPSVLDLNHLIETQLGMLQRLLPENIELTFRPDKKLRGTRSDLGQLQQVVMNLTVNSRDALPHGGVITIETSNAELASTGKAGEPGIPCVMFSVSDNGIGMDSATLARIYEPFFTTKEPGKGTGLGLATVFGIVKQSEGQLFVQSQPGVGTTFKVYLPAVDGAPEALTNQALSELPGGIETILLAEDQESVRAPAEEYLVSKGYTVLAARDGDEALRIASRHKRPIHLLLTDVIMPGMGGGELAEAFRLLHPGAQVMFMSGYSDNLLSDHRDLIRPEELLQKPFRLPILGNRVREILDLNAS